MNPIAFADSHPGCERNDKVGVFVCWAADVTKTSLALQPASSAARASLPPSLHPNLGPPVSQGQPVLPNGQLWQQHLLVLMVSAKLLADAEAAMQTSSDAAAAASKRAGT